uniref:Exonuclease domain-containing protein n=1 Tax=Eutreptiella gymnastica TaxID=73025 RepID=A0A7S1N862_9EUGL|mmetsp:Transcript_136518/g.236909  ORF Transcript_136518/g.236909 Transcript_136518/m.236909 type:complete len:485 (+) Transcript_136518:86-1540(+)
MAAVWDFPKFYLDGSLVECTNGSKPVCVALLNEEGSILLNCYVVPNGAVTNWQTNLTTLSSFNDLLECNPVHLEQVLEYLRHFIPADSVLIGHEISAIVDAFGLVKGEDYAALIETSDWFAVQLSATLCQRFTLAHILQHLLGDEIPEAESGKRDPMLDAQYARMLYFSYKDVPYDHPVMHQARQTLYEALPKDKRLVDPALTVRIVGIPEGMDEKEIKKSIVPRQVVHLVEKVADITWSENKGVVTGNTTVIFKTAHDVSQTVLRLHSNPDDWDWVVKKEGQCYAHKQNGIRIEEAEDVSLKVYVHSIPDDWNEGDVKKKLVPEMLQTHVKEIKQTQFKRTKDRSKLLGRTHIMFNEEWCVMEMLRMMQTLFLDDWSWTTQQDGTLLFCHKKENIMVEPALPMTWEELMSVFEPEQPTAREEWQPMQYGWPQETEVEVNVDVDAIGVDEEAGPEEEEAEEQEATEEDETDMELCPEESAMEVC